MRVVITGGDGYGKSALLKELEYRGYKTKEEVARRLIVKAGRNIHREDRPAFQRRVLKEQIKQFKTEGLTFYDRGIPDATAYLLFEGLKVPEGFIEANKKYRYDQIFFVERLPEHEDDNVRENPENAAKAHRILKKVYRSLGYKPVSLPPVGIKDRADLVLKHLEIEGKENYE